MPTPIQKTFKIGGGENETLNRRAVGRGQRHVECHVDGNGRFVPAGVRVGVARGEMDDRLHPRQHIPPTAVAGIGQVAFEQFDRRRSARPVLRGHGLQRLQLRRRRGAHVQPDQQRARTGAGQVLQQLRTQIAKPARDRHGTRGRHSVSILYIESKGGPVNTKSTGPPS